MPYLILALGLWLLSKRTIKKPQAQSDEQKAQAQTADPVNVKSALPHYPEPLDRAPRRSDKQTRTRNESKWMTIFTGLIFVVTAVHAGVSFLQWRSVERQADLTSGTVAVMRKQLEITDRPWVSVKVAANAPFVFPNSDSAIFSVEYILENVGNSVATNVTIYDEVFLATLDSGVNEPVERQRQLCEDLASGKVGLLSIAIFPKETRRTDQAFGISNQTIHDRKTGNDIMPVLIGCVDYTSSNGTHHQTGFLYSVQVYDPIRAKGHNWAFEIGREIPKDKIVFVRYWIGGDYAN